MSPRLASRLRRVYRCPTCGAWRIRPIPSDPNRSPHACICRDPTGAPHLRVVRGHRQSRNEDGDAA